MEQGVEEVTQHKVLGLLVTDGNIRVEDLIDWIDSRDAACAEYLSPALKQYLEEPKDVTDL